MRTWLGSIVLVVVGAFAVASGCGAPDVVRGGPGLAAGNDGGAAGDAGSHNGSGATSGGLAVGEGGSFGDGCPSTCADLNANCGTVTDAKCSGVIECGTCTGAEFCGGDGPSRCGTGTGTGDGGACSGANCMSCAPKTCDDLGFTCGPAGDTCGAKLDCGPNTCPIPGWKCGGGAKPGVCGCTGACSEVVDCSGAAKKTTSLTGKVYDPAGNNPLYHVFVYVANKPQDPDLITFPKGVTCDVCGASAAGSPLLSADGTAGTYTDETGTFTLTNVPVGKDITLVIQLGRWRRVFKVDVNTPCDSNPITDKRFTMPKTQAEGNIPLMAMVTGEADSLECVLRKIGIADSEFTDPAGGGRIQFYLGNDTTKMGGNAGQSIDAATPNQDALFEPDGNGTPVINGYDMTILSCQGAAYTQSVADQAKLRNYAAAGGRVFTSHYSYSWLTNNDADATKKGVADNWSEVAKWKADEADRAETAVGIIDQTSNPKGKAFQGWLEAVGASPGKAGTPGTTDVIVIRHDTDSVSAVSGQTQQWLYRDGTNPRTCNLGGASCTSDASCSPLKYCSTKTSATCAVNGDCTAKVCKNLNGNPACTKNSDCGAGTNCVAQTCKTNTCNGTDYTNTHLPLHFTYNAPVNLTEDLTKTPPALQCGRVLFSDFHVQDAHEHGKVFPAQCDTKPMNSQEKLLEFMIFDLGSCVPPATACVPANACPAGEDCGFAADGCGGLIACGVCPTGEACGVGNPPVPNKCGKGTQTCTPTTCAAQGLECGPAADGCGAKIDSCGMCAAGDLCVRGKCKHVN
ncbi:MAG: hypothetical protein ABI488_25450 [Polyangiaceae bacterium]